MATLKGASPSILKKEKIETERGVETRALLSWEAPTRPFKKRDREFFSNAVAIAFLVGVILFFLKEWFLIIAIIALLFLVYILSTVPPEKVEHKITNRGIVTGGKSYLWNELGNFWFAQQLGEKTLNIEVPFQIPRRLILLLGDQKEEVLKKLLSRFLESEEPTPGFTERAGEWLSKKIPLEKSAS